MRADTHDGLEWTHQSKVGYIDARPLATNSSNLLAARSARPVPEWVTGHVSDI
jgi:hypothetical protein